MHLSATMLGIEADAAANRLMLNPNFPSWIAVASLEHLRLGKNRVSLRLSRGARGGKYALRVEDNPGGVEVASA